MTAVSGTPATERPDALAAYRDDGPVARALGRVGRTVPVPAVALMAAGVAVLLAAIAIGGGDTSVPVAGAVIAWTVLCGGIAAGRPPGGRLRWTQPPLARLCEYAGILWLAAIAGEASLPAAFAVLAAVAFRTYDLVYRLRHRGVSPAGWANALAAGWDGRLVIAFVLLAVGALPAGFFIWAAVLAVALVGEAIAGWVVIGRVQRPVEYEDEEDEGQ